MLEGIISKSLSILGSGLPSAFSNVIPRGPGFDNWGSTVKGSGLYNRAKQKAYHQTNFEWAFFTDKHFSNSYSYVAIYILHALSISIDSIPGGYIIYGIRNII